MDWYGWNDASYRSEFISVSTSPDLRSRSIEAIKYYFFPIQLMRFVEGNRAGWCYKQCDSGYAGQTRFGYTACGARQ